MWAVVRARKKFEFRAVSKMKVNVKFIDLLASILALVSGEGCHCKARGVHTKCRCCLLSFHGREHE